MEWLEHYPKLSRKSILDEINRNFVVKESPLKLKISASVRKDYQKALSKPQVNIHILDAITSKVLKMMLYNSLPQYYDEQRIIKSV
jgi:Regulator of G protein signaling domain